MEVQVRRSEMRAGLVMFFTVALAGCSSTSGPATTDTSSDALLSLEQRVEFLQRYVAFRRGDSDLGFRVMYQNNSAGLVPGPSDWDIQLVAVVPQAELLEWVPAGAASTPSADTQWLAGVPVAEMATGIREWYINPGVVVGIDRERSVVAYRRWTR